jgi:hypothetical protein
MEVVDLGLSHLEPISISLDEPKSSGGGNSMNFGPGIELLMNDKKRSSSNNVNVDLGELDNLENELNELSGNGGSSSSGTTKSFGGIGDFTSGLFNFGGNGGNDKNVFVEKSDSNIGQATKDTIGNSKTWDGFSKMTDIPDTGSSFSSSSKLNEREKRRKKKMMIKKLEEWYEKGLIKNISHFNNDSSYEEVEDEYETAVEDKRKKDSIKLHGYWLMTFINTIEWANSAFDPFGINLDGWGEQISEDMDSYEEIFSELHDKYGKVKMSPEISLLMRLGFSAAVVNFTNKALSTATPGFNDVIRQSPELMKMFTNATVSSMNQQSPGFAFASQMMNQPEQINTSFGPPPKPVETKNQAPPPRPTMQFTEAPGNRPDINMARGAMFKEQGVDINKYGDAQKQERSVRPPQQQQPSASPAARQEMKGPSVDIDNLLSGLKTKTVNIHENTQVQNEDDSMISISSLKDMQNVNAPKRTNRRKNRSDKNTISLDI